MKSVLGLVGCAVLAVACGGNSGNALFDDVGGAKGTGASGATDGGKANTNGGGSSGGAGATSAGTSQGGTPGGGNSTTGGNGTSGNSNAGDTGDGGDTTGPLTPEAIYVATTGNDSADCGLTKADPCQSISQGISRGVEAGRASVDVQAGTYAGVVVLQGGISVVGGFDSDWQPGAHTDSGHGVIIQGALDADSQEYLAVWAHDLDESASLQNLEIDAPDAVGQKAGSLDGRSSYGIHAVAAKLSLKDVDIKAGNGAKGANGSDGQDAVATAVAAGMNGTLGGNGASNDAVCNVEPSPGGPAGTNTCSSSPSTVLMNGGKGGGGGGRDQSCNGGNPQNWNYTAQPGQDGEDAAVSSAQVGNGGIHGSGGDTCGATTPGDPGAFINGAKGSKAATGGKLIGDFWYASPGGDGATGQNGSGGGGGGGAGGCDLNFNGTTDARGAGGGGGGAGGCAARGGGGGGGGGGSSFGILAIASTITVANVNIARGNAADGGAGGTGGQGQSGGLGLAGGLHPGASGSATAAAAGKGGDGAHGGHGGGGAGGNGGLATGVALETGSKLNGTPTITGGAAGGGGDGGASAPNAPNAERDGATGEAGTDGALSETFDF